MLGALSPVGAQSPVGALSLRVDSDLYILSGAEEGDEIGDD